MSILTDNPLAHAARVILVKYPVLVLDYSAFPEQMSDQ